MGYPAGQDDSTSLRNRLVSGLHSHCPLQLAVPLVILRVCARTPPIAAMDHYRSHPDLKCHTTTRIQVQLGFDRIAPLGGEEEEILRSHSASGCSRRLDDVSRRDATRSGIRNRLQADLLSSGRIGIGVGVPVSVRCKTEITCQHGPGPSSHVLRRVRLPAPASPAQDKDSSSELLPYRATSART